MVYLKLEETRERERERESERDEYDKLILYALSKKNKKHIIVKLRELS